jgi:hypothetical protein
LARTKNGPELERRELLRRAFWGAAGLAGASVAVSTGSATGLGEHADAGTKRLVIDMACLGNTFRFVPVPGDNMNDDLRGAPFSVEGNIYPAGTIKDGFDPARVKPTGTWVCRGWLMVAPGRPTPAVITTQEYFLSEALGGPDAFVADQLVSSGLEGDGKRPPVRSVIGGTGRYAGARGVVIQHGLGTNTTNLWLGGVLGPAPNFRFEFRLQ